MTEPLHPRLSTKIAYRLYLATMRFESMSLLPVRRKLLDVMLGRKHRNLNIFAHVFIDGYAGLRLGNDVSIHRWSYISAGGGLSIADYVSIAHGTTILTSNHGFADPGAPIKYQQVEFVPVSIASNVWIGAKVCILAGVCIPTGTVVAAGSVITKSFEEPDTIIGGVPARKLKDRLGSADQ